MHKNSLSPVQSHFITKNSTRVISQRGGLAVLPCSVTMSTPATVSKYLYIISLNRKTNPPTIANIATFHSHIRKHGLTNSPPP